MANKYFVWKNGNPQDWEELTGTEFYALTKSDAAKGRYFTKMTSDEEEDDILIFESTKEVFDKNKQDRNRVTYLAERDANYVVSTFSALNADTEEDDNLLIEEQLVDEGSSLEAIFFEKISNAEVERFLSSLNELDRAIFENIFLKQGKQENYMTQTEIANQFDISLATITRRKRIFVNFLRTFQKP